MMTKKKNNEALSNQSTSKTTAVGWFVPYMKHASPACLLCELLAAQVPELSSAHVRTMLSHLYYACTLSCIPKVLHLLTIVLL
jgi:hypothetical protein